MVANKSLGLSNNSKIVTACLSVSFSKPSISLGFKEKKATSEPEISADAPNNTISITIEIITDRGLTSTESDTFRRKEVEFNFLYLVY